MLADGGGVDAKASDPESVMCRTGWDLAPITPSLFGIPAGLIPQQTPALQVFSGGLELGLQTPLQPSNVVPRSNNGGYVLPTPLLTCLPDTVAGHPPLALTLPMEMPIPDTVVKDNVIGTSHEDDNDIDDDDENDEGEGCNDWTTNDDDSKPARKRRRTGGNTHAERRRQDIAAAKSRIDVYIEQIRNLCHEGIEETFSYPRCSKEVLLRHLPEGVDSSLKTLIKSHDPHIPHGFFESYRTDHRERLFATANLIYRTFDAEVARRRNRRFGNDKKRWRQPIDLSTVKPSAALKELAATAAAAAGPATPEHESSSGTFGGGFKGVSNSFESVLGKMANAPLAVLRTRVTTKLAKSESRALENTTGVAPVSALPSPLADPKGGLPDPKGGLPDPKGVLPDKTPTPQLGSGAVSAAAARCSRLWVMGAPPSQSGPRKARPAIAFIPKQEHT